MTTANRTTAFDKPFGDNIINASDALYRACKELNEAISSLEVARNQAQSLASVRAIEEAQRALRMQHDALEKQKLLRSEFDNLHNLYGDDKREVIEDLAA